MTDKPKPVSEARKAKMREYYAKNRDQKKAYQREYRKTRREQIAALQREYYETHREQIAAQKREYRKTHREQIAARKREHYVKNREPVVAYQREYYETHREQIAARKREYCAKNRERLTEYFRQKFASDPAYRLGVNLRSRLNVAVRNGYRAGSAVRDLGCSIEEFKAYIEGLFLPGMSWDNWGEWHLDHIEPLASFDLSDREQFLAACHFTNLQPLWAADNIRKGARSLGPATSCQNDC